LRFPRCDNLSALIARSRPDVDDPVTRGGNPHIMLDDDHGISGVN
jgi:hypothetical protein